MKASKLCLIVMMWFFTLISAAGLVATTMLFLIEGAMPMEYGPKRLGVLVLMMSCSALAGWAALVCARGLKMRTHPQDFPQL